MDIDQAGPAPNAPEIPDATPTPEATRAPEATPTPEAPAPQAPGAPAAPNRTTRAGRNLPVAIGVGAALGGLVFLTLLTVKATFLLYVGAAVAVS